MTQTTKKSKRGGPRPNSGRPKGNPKVLVAKRVPTEIAADVIKYINTQIKEYEKRASILKSK